ncbi:DNRLRE domain-containing protein [Nonomuraea sp. NBC_00507]|uniref:polysaccharide lyase family 8 super-sandwich domain-containing protein n=1 Tax=Nonomuraea sp. NBC_00507 TaxID=2976002 RepID=UPI002E197FA3
MNVHRVGDGWEEDTITWGTKPSIGSRLATMRATAAGGWLSVDVTDCVRGIADTGHVDFAILQPAGQGLSVQIGSREHRTLRPVLRFTLAKPVESVETIVENRHLHASGTNALTVDGTVQPVSQGWSETFPAARWAHLEGVGGYVFPGGAELHASRAERTGSWRDISTGTVIGDPTPITRRYLTMWFDHGSAPDQATYAYALLPGATAQQTADRAEGLVRIVANNEELQASR